MKKPFIRSAHCGLFYLHQPSGKPGFLQIKKPGTYVQGFFICRGGRITCVDPGWGDLNEKAFHSLRSLRAFYFQQPSGKPGLPNKKAPALTCKAFSFVGVAGLPVLILVWGDLNEKAFHSLRSLRAFLFPANSRQAWVYPK